MSILDKKQESDFPHIADQMQTEDPQILIRSSFGYTLFTVFLMLFGAVYELFSHEVYSYYMIYACAIPLVLGLVPSLIMLVLKKQAPERMVRRLWNAGMITLSTGSVYKGILEIYGSTNKLIFVYLIAGIILLAAGGIRMLVRKKRIPSVHM